MQTFKTQTTTDGFMWGKGGRGVERVSWSQVLRFWLPEGALRVRKKLKRRFFDFKQKKERNQRA